MFINQKFRDIGNKTKHVIKSLEISTTNNGTFHNIVSFDMKLIDGSHLKIDDVSVEIYHTVETIKKIMGGVNNMFERWKNIFQFQNDIIPYFKPYTTCQCVILGKEKFERSSVNINYEYDSKIDEYSIYQNDYDFVILPFCMGCAGSYYLSKYIMYKQIRYKYDNKPPRVYYINRNKDANMIRFEPILTITDYQLMQFNKRNQALFDLLIIPH